MISLKILDTKNFMKHLLLQETFDHFLMVDSSITTFNTFSIDGVLQKSYYTEEELEFAGLTGTVYTKWYQTRPFFYSLVKGNHTPLNFKIVFQLSPNNTEKLLTGAGSSLTPADVAGLYLNVKFDGKQATCITGSSLNIFTLDKTLEHAWDEMIKKFFLQKEIPFE